MFSIAIEYHLNVGGAVAAKKPHIPSMPNFISPYSCNGHHLIVFFSFSQHIKNVRRCSWTAVISETWWTFSLPLNFCRPPPSTEMSARRHLITTLVSWYLSTIHKIDTITGARLLLPVVFFLNAGFDFWEGATHLKHPVSSLPVQSVVCTLLM